MTIAVSSSPGATFDPCERQLLCDYVQAHGVPESWPQLARGFTHYARGAAVAIDELAVLCLKLMSLSDEDVVRLLESSRFGGSRQTNATARLQRWAA